MSILKSIGNTPLVELKHIWQSKSVKIFAKVEGVNPGGSIKDRVAYQMITDAIKNGELVPNMQVTEATSGNTGIGLAMVCAALKYRCLLVMPKSVSEERVKLCQAFGASIVLVDGNTDDAIKYVEKLKFNKYIYVPNQFDNPSNWKTHFLHTGPEISRQLHQYLNTTKPPNPNVLVASCGTTGTIRGCKTWFDYNYNVIKDCHKGEQIKTKTIAVFPRKNSKIQGLKNLRFSKIPKIYDKSFINQRDIADDDNSFLMAKRLAQKEGIFCGMSSGAAMCSAIKEAKKMDYGWIVVILPDNGYRYISEGIF